MTVERRVDATPDQVWTVLADGWLYTGWVVGASHIRAVDEGWPAVGTRIHHSVGSWPVLIEDSTEVLLSEPASRLVLRARAWPVGEARVDLRLRPDGAGCTISMAEEPTKGPGKWVHTPIQQRLLEARNREALARLVSLVEGRS